MKVSVLVPVYGVERYVEQCARSLMEQSYQDIEYIFVNDCTPDDSIAILKKVIENYPSRKDNVRIIDHKENLGVGAVRRDAIYAATGETIMFVDSDDFVTTDAVQCLVNEMQASQADIVDGGYAVVTKEEVVQKKIPLHLSTRAYLKTILCQNVEQNRIWGRLIKKSLFDDYNINFQQGIDYSEDFSVLPLLLLNARRSWMDDCLCFYRNDNPQSYTNSITIKNAISFFESQQIVAKFLTMHTRWKEFSFAAEIGWVNVWRFARRFNVDKTLVDEHFSMSPSHFVTNCLAKMMKSNKIPFFIINFIYKAIRRIYLIFEK